MVVKSVVINNSFQDAEPVPRLVKLACQFQSRLELSDKDRKINIKSMLGVMALNLSPGMTVDISAEGADEKEALAALEDFFAGNDK